MTQPVPDSSSAPSFDSPVPPPHVPQSGDGWVQCACGNRHWGLFGAAGLFLVCRDGDGRWAEVVMQHRALWSHQGGTWGIPGGALNAHESAREGAVREAVEEAGVLPDAVRVLGSHALTHADWSYVTVVAECTDPLAVVSATDAESLEVRWLPLDLLRMAVDQASASVSWGGVQVELLAPFFGALPALLRILDDSL